MAISSNKENLQFLKMMISTSPKPLATCREVSLLLMIILILFMSWMDPLILRLIRRNQANYKRSILLVSKKISPNWSLVPSQKISQLINQTSKNWHTSRCLFQLLILNYGTKCPIATSIHTNQLGHSLIRTENVNFTKNFLKTKKIIISLISKSSSR